MPVEQSAIKMASPYLRTSLSDSPFARLYRSESLTANRTLTEADGGTIFQCNKAASLVIALPALESIDVGLWYEFWYETAVSGGSSTITAQSGDLLQGMIKSIDSDSSDVVARWSPDFVDDLIITFNGTTTGGLKGTHIRVFAASPTKWLVTGDSVASGTVATPFS